MSNSSEWLRCFLAARGLVRPDHRPLYAYKCTEEEYSGLTAVLGALDPTTARLSASREAQICFAIHASEWWRRNYAGGPWKWEPLLQAIGWRIEFTDLYPMLRAAWHWLGVKPVILGSQLRYLGTCACQGGVPFALIAQGAGPITRFLKALLIDYRTFRRVVDDGTILARPLRTHLPVTLQQEPVFRICADLMDQIWNLREQIAGADDPIAILDAQDAHWREKMPVDMGDETARSLIAGLLSEAARADVPATAEFRVVRFLEQRSASPTLGVHFQIPAVMSVAQFKALAHISGDLPRRFELRAGIDTPRAVASGRVSGEEVVFNPFTLPADWAARVAADDLSFSIVAGGLIGDRFTPRGGEALSELPWIFIDREGDARRFEFYGEGSVRTRLSSVVVACLADAASTLRSGAAIKEWAAALPDRFLFTVTGEVRVETAIGICAIRTAQESESASIHELSGRRCFQLQSELPLFHGQPTVYATTADGTRAQVPEHQISWRAGRDWLPKPKHTGVWNLRRQIGGETVFAARVCILGEQFEARLIAGEQANAGALELHGVPLAIVGCDDEDVQLEKSENGAVIRARITADPANVPGLLRLSLKLPFSDTLPFTIPFPGRGGRFVLGVTRTADLQHSLCISTLHGWCARVVSPEPSERFKLFGDLVANDLSGSLIKLVRFSVDLPKISDFVSELPLIDVRDRLLTLFAATKDIDARVRLTLQGMGQQTLVITYVRRFRAEIKVETAGLFRVEDPDGLADSIPEVGALKLADPAIGIVPLDTQFSESVIRGWTLPRQCQDGSTWLVVAQRDDEFFARPEVIRSSVNGGPDRRGLEKSSPGESTDVPVLLSEAAEIPDVTARAHAMTTILHQPATPAVAALNTRYLSDLIRESHGLPPSTFTALDRLVNCPNALVRLLLAADAALRPQIWDLETELPFAWVLIPFRVWVDEFRQFAKRVVDDLTKMDIRANAAQSWVLDHLLAVMEEGAYRYGALQLHSELARFAIYGMAATQSLKLAGDQQMVKRLAEMLREEEQRLLLADIEWPFGPDRDDWCKLAPLPKVAWAQYWRDTAGTGFRRPLLDAPFGAVRVATVGVPVPRNLVHATKLLRSFSPRWFDTTYRLFAFIALGNEPSRIE
jgi:hypothetical protein